MRGEGDDSGTVVGELQGSERNGEGSREAQFIIGAAPSSKRARANRATPGVRALAERLGVSLEAIKGSGPGGLITNDDVHRQASHQKQLGEAEGLRGQRRTMTGQCANPIVSPPQVAIVGAGKIREKVVP